MSEAAARLAAVRARIMQSACVAGRDPADITLIAVSKGRTVAEIEALIEAGQGYFGENRVAEAITKWAELRTRHPHIRLHMIGQLQSNKAEEAARTFDVIHSLDRMSLLRALESADWAGPTYIQVNIGDEPQKGGVPLADLDALLQAARATRIQVTGLMAIPPANLEPSPYFALLAKLARRHGVDGLSMGMSSDFPQAVTLGATAVRVGTALFEG